VFDLIVPTNNYTADMKLFKNLRASKKGDHYCVLAITEKIYLRGIDFRGELTLFLGAKFSSIYERNLGLSRVGRFSYSYKIIQIGPNGGMVDKSR
jgi:hypothetical protein